MSRNRAYSNVLTLILGLTAIVLFPLIQDKRDGVSCSHKSFSIKADCESGVAVGDQGLTTFSFELSSVGALDSHAAVYYKDISGSRVSIISLDIQSVLDNRLNAVVTIGHRLSLTPYQIYFNYEINKPATLFVSIEDSKWIHTKLNGNLIQSQRWNAPIFLKYNPRETIVTANNEEYFSDIVLTTRTYTTHTNFGYLLIFVSLLLIILFRLSTISQPTLMSTAGNWGQPEIKNMTILSLSITFSSVSLFKLLDLSYQKYFDMNGATFAEAARYSDWYQVFDLAHSSQPYLLGNSNYPPAFLALLKVLPYSLCVPIMILTIVGFIGLTAGLLTRTFHKNHAVNLFLSTGLVLFSYPVIFATDRGSTEFLLGLLLVGFIINCRAGRMKWAAILLGIAIGLKIYPLLLVPVFLLTAKRLNLIFISIGTAALCSIIGSQILTQSPIRGIGDFLNAASKSNIGEQFHNNQNLAARATSIYSWAYNLKVFRVLISKGDEIPTVSGWIITILIAVLMVYFIVKLFLRQHDIPSAIFSGVALILLVTPLSNDYRLLLLIPAAVNWYSTSTYRLNSRRMWVFVGVCLASRPILYISESAMTLGGLLTAPLLLLIFVKVLQTEKEEQSLVKEIR